MTKAKLYLRASALPAIAAALALISTPTLAQQVQPAPTDPAAGTTSVPAPQSGPEQQAAPTATDTVPETSSVPDISSSSAASTADSTVAINPAKHAPRTVKRGAISKTSAHEASVTTGSSPSRAASAPVPPKAPLMPTAAAIAAAKPAPAARTTQPAQKGNDTALEIGGGAAALLALGGAAFAIARRRRNEVEEDGYENEEYGEPEAAAEPQPDEIGLMPESRAEAMAIAEPKTASPPASAFAWGNRAAPETQVEKSNDDRRPGETWVERAYRGPTPNNPSVSLRHRLKRAAFFDKREREVAEGRALPMDPGAGLPEASAAGERELVAS